jgi:hypothetical protein
MQYRVKCVSNGWTSWYIPQKRYKWLPIWFSFHLHIHDTRTKIIFDNQLGADKWLKQTQSN